MRCCIVCSHDKRLIAKVRRNFASVVVALLFSVRGKRVHLAGFNFCVTELTMKCARLITDDERDVIESVLYALIATEQKQNVHLTVIVNMNTVAVLSNIK